MTQYIEIDSRFRNRVLYPNPFDFTLSSENTGQSSDGNTSINPISDAYPLYNFQGPHPELLGIDKEDDGDDTKNKFGGIPQSRFGGTGSNSDFEITHESNFEIDTTNPWQITTNIGNNSFGPGNNKNVHLDGVPIDKIGTGHASYRTIINENKTLYPNQYEYDFNSSNSYKGFPYSSSVDNYYDGMFLSRYTSQVNGRNPDETSEIISFKGSNKIFRKSDINNKLYYSVNNEIKELTTSDIDISQSIYTNGPNSCLLKNDFSDNWRCEDFWGVNNTSLLSVSKPSEITIHAGSNIDNYYKDYYIEDCTLPLGELDGLSSNLSDSKHRFKKIISYDGTTKKAILETPFPIATYTDNYPSLITDNNLSKININPDRANPFSLNQTPYWFSVTYLYPIEFRISDDWTKLIYKWNGNVKGGAKGWIPQDRYRIRKHIPLVMGWGIHEDRDGSRARKGKKTNSNEKEQDDLYSGTGPRSGSNTAVFTANIIERGRNFSTNYIYGTGNTINDLYIEIINTFNNGSIKDFRIVWPGSGFNINQEVEIINNGNDNATLSVKTLCQSIDISNGFAGNTTGRENLSKEYGYYNNKLLYIPSRGPEKKSSQYLTKYHLTGHLKTVKPYSKGHDPPFINQYPLRLSDNEYTSDDTGIINIDKYLYCNKTTLYQNNTTSNWVINDKLNECAVILCKKGFSTIVTGNINNGENADTGEESVYNINNKLQPIYGYNRTAMDNSYNWEILECDKDGVNTIKYTDNNVQNYKKMFITLQSIVIPNILIKSYLTDKTIFASHFYVELTNYDTNITNKIISNKNYKTALFKVSTENIPDLTNLNFCRFTGDNMEQEFVIDITNNISFKLLLNDGTVIKPHLQDISPPSDPDENLQISALFKIRKVE